MNWREIKYTLKNIPIIGTTYQLLIGNRKIKKKRTESQKLLQDNGIELLTQIEHALRSYNDSYIYFADYGTLLGIVRDKKFISWDMDVDYGLIINNGFDWNKFESHLNNYGFKKVREYRYKNLIKEQTYSFSGLTIDFFAKIDDGKNSVAYGFYTKKGYVYSNMDSRHVREVRYARVLSVRKEEFCGIDVTIPSNAEEYLESAYSKNWRIPDPKWDDNNCDNRNVTLLDDLGVGIFYE